MNDENIVGWVFVMLTFVMIIVCTGTLTKDNTHISLEVIEAMIKKCESNEGLDYIEHDYDVVCKNGAEFSRDWLK